MLKPNSLRAEIVKFMPELARDPDLLSMWSERGSMRATENRQAGFAWSYDLEILLSEFTGEPALLFFVVQNWCRKQQPELIAAGATEIPFEVEFIDHTTVDIKITLALSEVVRAQPREDGEGWELETVEETVPLFPDAEPLRELEGEITSLWVRSGDVTRRVAPAEAA